LNGGLAIWHLEVGVADSIPAVTFFSLLSYLAELSVDIFSLSMTIST